MDLQDGAVVDMEESDFGKPEVLRRAGRTLESTETPEVILQTCGQGRAPPPTNDSKG